MLKKILIIVAVVIVVFLIVVARQPEDFRVMRFTTIAAPQAAIFPHVNELRKWDAWSPWAKLDPTAKNTFDGPPAGQGAVMAWAGNSQVGEGRMTITESKPSELVRCRLEFFKPMAGVSDTDFAFRPEGNQTVVVWTMSGKNNFIAKAMCLFMNMDKMVGGQFEQGLASMKAIVEGGAKP
ncbi:MAG: SRPBCC family protein [Verrucomicrobia bacterium]|nr:SRPBCC family protein [Verrucomicrobiota bacterium]